MSRLKRLIHEIHRRSLWQVLGIYVVGGWLMLQVVDTLAGALNLPDWAPPLALFLLVVGLPLVLATAFLQEGGPARTPTGSPAEGEEEPAGVSDGDPAAAAVSHSDAPPHAPPSDSSWGRTLTWRNVLFTGTAAFALWGVVAAVWLLVGGRSPGEGARPTDGRALSSEVIAVIPFSVQGSSDFAYLGRGIVDLLSTKLDGAGELRTVDSSGLLAVFEREGVRAGDPEAARRMAGEFGAGHFITGNIVEAGGHLQVSAGLYRTADGGDRVGEGTADGQADAVFEVVDELASELLSSMSGGPSARVRRVAAVTTANLPAYKRFLEGEDLLRRGQFGAGVEAFQRAVEEDSLFALAHYRLSLAAEWNLQDSLAREAAEVAVRHAGRLSERDRRLLEAFLIRRSGDNAEAEERYRSILATYPDDVEAWLDLVEVLFHANPLRGRSFTDARPALERVLFFQREHSTSLIHLSRVAAFERDLAGLDSLADKFVALNPSPERALEVQSLRAFTKADTGAIETIVAGLGETQNDLSVALSVWDVAVFSRDLPGAARLAGLLTAPTRSPEARRLGHAWLAHLQLATGQWEDAKAQLAELERIAPGVALEYRALLSILLSTPAFGHVDPSELAALRDRLVRLDPASIATSDNPSVVFTANDALHPLFRSYLLGLTSARIGDSNRALGYAGQLEAIELPATAGSLSSDLAHSVRSAVHRVAGRPEEALRELDLARAATWYGQTMASPLYCLVFDRFARAELLLELGRDREALDWYAHLVETSPFETPYLALSHLRQGETYDRLGDLERAASHYEAFVELWRDADPGFQPRVTAARERLNQLAAGYDATSDEAPTLEDN